MKKLFLILLLFSFNNVYAENIEYDIKNSSKIYKLTSELNEISGIDIIDNNIVLCIEDETGNIYKYDLNKSNIIDKIKFSENGDYEDIAVVGNTVYVLRSDGVLFEIQNYNKVPNVVEHILDIDSKNNEALCYDKKNNILLIIPKIKAGKGSEYKDKIVFYAFDLKTKKLKDKPFLVFELKNISDFLGLEYRKHIKKNKKGKIKKNKKILVKFRPSAIAIHSITGYIYLISALDSKMVVLNNNEIVDIVFLDKNIFIQPEGIDFFDNGDLLISNEYKGKEPNILRFNSIK
jgi:hypothetical protein